MFESLATLVVNANSAMAMQLVQQLDHAGLRAEAATSCWAAHAAMLERFYRSLVCFVDPSSPSDMECVSTLRRRSPRSWIILISSSAALDARRLTARCGADALVTIPFSIDDLTARLAALARRARPQDGGY